MSSRIAVGYELSALASRPPPGPPPPGRCRHQKGQPPAGKGWGLPVDSRLARCYIELVDLPSLVPLDSDGELPVAGQAGGRWDELADDHVLLQAGEAILLALDCRVGEDAGRLLEGGRGEEAVGGQRGLRDAEQDRVEGGWLAPLLLDLRVLGEKGELVGDLLGQERRIARIVHDHLAQHLADYYLDVLVVDDDALGPVDLLDLSHQVTLGGRGATTVAQIVLQDRVRVHRAVSDRGVRSNLSALDELGLQEPPL